MWSEFFGLLHAKQLKGVARMEMKIITINDVPRGLITMDELGSHAFLSWLRRFLNSGALYVGPTHLLEEVGSWYISASTEDGIVAIRGLDGKLRALLNACRHRELQIFVTKGETVGDRCGKLTSKLIVCPGHNTNYTSDGHHYYSPALKVRKVECLGLHELPIQSIGGLLWTGSDDDLKPIQKILNSPLMQKRDVSSFIPPNYRLDTIVVYEEKFNPTTAMVVYGDVDHVDDMFHDYTLKRCVVTKGLEIDITTTEAASVQVVPWRKECDTKATDAWRTYHAEAAKYYAKHQDDARGEQVVWFAFYHDHTTVEEFPAMGVVSRFAPSRILGCTRNVVEFYFPDDAPEALRAAGVAAYRELAPEDAEISRRIEQGSEHLRMFGKGGEVGGPMHPLEEGVVVHYTEWLNKHWVNHKRLSRIL